MRIFFLIVLLNVLVLGVISLLTPFAPIWLGGLIGILVFLLVGRIAASFIE